MDLIHPEQKQLKVDVLFSSNSKTLIFFVTRNSTIMDSTRPKKNTEKLKEKTVENLDKKLKCYNNWISDAHSL